MATGQAIPFKEVVSHNTVKGSRQMIIVIVTISIRQWLFLIPPFIRGRKLNGGTVAITIYQVDVMGLITFLILMSNQTR